MNLTGKERFQAAADMEVNSVPDGFVVYDNRNEKVHYLNPVAAVIFSVCNGRKTVEEIGDFLREAYSLDAPPDIAPFLAELENAGLVSRLD